MIITKLQGGLGNQLFEYAFGRRLAIENQTELKIDLASYLTDPQRSYELGVFNIDATIATPDEVGAFVGTTHAGKKIKRLVGHYNLNNYIQEPHFAFWPKALSTKSPAYLEGYWQSEKYFKPIETKLRQELTLRTPLCGEAETMRARISSSRSVSLHVRRKDYIDSQFLELTPEYYQKAMGRIRSAEAEPSYFVFSDDVSWARQNLALPTSTVFVSTLGLRNYEELFLMSYCKYHIVANSSFSWWGAWLDPNPHKLIVAPKRWFISDVHDTKDLVPPQWFTI
ncbi:MAG TPA: alpha-1,2-fucosyltransferase [Candidatus Paceibacterota bacterium]